MSFLKRLLPSRGPSDMDLEYEVLVERSMEELAVRTASHNELFQLETADWRADANARKIVFSAPNGMEAVADLQIVGTIDTHDGTWLWSWANETIPPALCAHAEAVRAYGEKHNLEQLVTRKFGCSESEAWRFTALACKLGGGQGAYRGPAGRALIFMTYGTPSVSKA